MPSAIHMSNARRILEQGKPVTLDIVKKDGSIMHAEEVVSLRFDYYTGLRTIKFIRSGQIRVIHDCCIISLNDLTVFL